MSNSKKRLSSYASDWILSSYTAQLKCIILLWVPIHLIHLVCPVCPAKRSPFYQCSSCAKEGGTKCKSERFLMLIMHYCGYADHRSRSKLVALSSNLRRPWTEASWPEIGKLTFPHLPTRSWRLGFFPVYSLTAAGWLAHLPHDPPPPKKHCWGVIIHLYTDESWSRKVFSLFIKHDPRS